MERPPKGPSPEVPREIRWNELSLDTFRSIETRFAQVDSESELQSSQPAPFLIGDLSGKAPSEKWQPRRRRPELRATPVVETPSEPTFQVPAHLSPSNRYWVFRVSGRRYALPVEKVLAVGRLDSRARITRIVRVEGGDLPVRDLKVPLRIEGPSGELFVATRNGVAWLVDGVEKVHLSHGIELGKAKVPTDLNPVHGALLLDEGNVSWAPVFLLDGDLIARGYSRAPNAFARPRRVS